MARADDLKKELSLTRRRLAGLRNQKAQFGARTDPSIMIEIEDLQIRVRELEAELGLAPDEAEPPQAAPDPMPPAPDSPVRYNLAKVKDLLIDTFSEQELREFCLYTPEFQAVHHNLKETDRTSQVLRQLLEFAQRKGLVPRLLDWARAESPDRYTEGEPYEG